MGRTAEFVKLDSNRLAFELARRGLNQTAFCRASGVPPETLSRALGGRPIRVGVLQRITTALAANRVLPVADLILAAPPRRRHKKAPAGERARASREGQQHGVASPAPTSATG